MNYILFKVGFSISIFYDSLKQNNVILRMHIFIVMLDNNRKNALITFFNPTIYRLYNFQIPQNMKINLLQKKTRYQV